MCLLVMPWRNPTSLLDFVAVLFYIFTTLLWRISNILKKETKYLETLRCPSWTHDQAHPPSLNPCVLFGEYSRHYMLSCFSRVRLCATPETAAHQAPPSLGFSRQAHWSGLPFPSPKHESEKWKWNRSVVSDSSWPHGLQPTRLLHPWDFPGKSTGVLEKRADSKVSLECNPEISVEPWHEH